MRVKPEQIGEHLRKNLAPVYLIAGDEPLQQGEIADAIRMAAKQRGFGMREIFSEDSGLSWPSVRAAFVSLSIFSERTIIDLRMPSAAPGNDGSKVLMAYCEQPTDDTLLLITTGKLSQEAMQARWFQAIDKAGVSIQVWPLAGKELLNWLQQRCKQRGLNVDSEGIKLLATRIEGNLLAAAQEIEKLFVLYGNGVLSAQQIADAVADSSRYDVYQLVDTVLSADADRIFRIFCHLRAEGVAAPIVLWALAREIRILIKIKKAMELGLSRVAVYRNYRIREIRQPLVDKALSQLNAAELARILRLCADIDRKIKGQASGDPWESLLGVCLLLAGIKVFQVSEQIG